MSWDLHLPLHTQWEKWGSGSMTKAFVMVIAPRSTVSSETKFVKESSKELRQKRMKKKMDLIYIFFKILRQICFNWVAGISLVGPSRNVGLLPLYWLSPHKLSSRLAFVTWHVSCSITLLIWPQTCHEIHIIHFGQYNIAFLKWFTVQMFYQIRYRKNRNIRARKDKESYLFLGLS